MHDDRAPSGRAAANDADILEQVLGAIYVFLYKDMCEKNFPIDKNIILILPIFTTLIFGILIYSRFRRVKLLAKYIKSSYEPSFGTIGETKIGYETFLANELKDRNSAIFISRVLSWLIQMIVAILIAIVMFTCHNCK